MAHSALKKRKNQAITKRSYVFTLIKYIKAKIRSSFFNGADRNIATLSKVRFLDFSAMMTDVSVMLLSSI